MVLRSLFGNEILPSVVQHLDRLLPGINLYVLFWASTSCTLKVKEDVDTEKKIELSRHLKKKTSPWWEFRPRKKKYTAGALGKRKL